MKIIAEIGHNHNGDMPLAKALIWAAKAAGADIAKFQLYDTDKLGLKKHEEAVREDLRQGEITKDQLLELKKECDKADIEFMASAFDLERLGWLEDVGVKRHKIASRMLEDEEFCKAVEATGKPIIASEGFTKRELNGDVTYLYCVAKYPPTDEDMKDMPENFDGRGFSDHTIGTEWTKEAIKRGATMIEKHFTIDRNMFGCDQKGSIEPKELKEFVDFVRRYGY